MKKKKKKPKPNHKPKHCKHHKEHNPKCDRCIEQDQNYTQNDYYVYPTTRVYEESKKCVTCEKCDVTKHPDINQYVLKSSVPPCPDMSNYAPKSMVKPCPDMSNYIKKSQINPCKKCPDMRNYILKSQIPAQPKCPKCPKCPVCPVCPVYPPSYKHIEDNPQFKEWFKNYSHHERKNIKKNFINKDECDKIKKDAYHEGHKEGHKKGKEHAYKHIAKGMGKSIKDSPNLKKCLENNIISEENSNSNSIPQYNTGNNYPKIGHPNSGYPLTGNGSRSLNQVYNC